MLVLCCGVYDVKSEKCRKCGKVIEGRGVDVEVGSYTRVYTICIDCAQKLEEWIKSKEVEDLVKGEVKDDM